jgi:hypothetical protein
MRIDLPHVRAIESAVSNDFDSLLRGLVTGLNRPLLVRGFKIKIPPTPINATALEIDVADSVVLHSSATESGTILTVPSNAAVEILQPSNTRVVGAFQAGTINYVSLDYRRVTDVSTVDQTAGWSASQKIEFQRTAPIGRLLEYRFIITTNGFSTNLPLYIVKVSNAGAVEWITKATPNLLRLGTGGANPNPANEYNYGNLTNSQTGTVREWINVTPGLSSNPLTVAPGDDPNAFEYGDFAFKNIKDWMDGVMTRFKKAFNSNYWYVDSLLPNGGLTLMNTWWDSNGSVLTGAGAISYNLVLESTKPSSGHYQSAFTDNTVLPGDSYIIGFTSGVKATVTSFNIYQFIINSLTSAGFVADEILLNRRLFRPTATAFSITEHNKASDKFAIFKRRSTPTGSPVSVTSYTYTNIDDGKLWFSKIDVTTGVAHNLKPGDSVALSGLTLTVGDAPNGAAYVKEVMSPTSFRYYHADILSGTAGVTAATVQNNTLERIPYMPKFTIDAWSYVGSAIKISAIDHNFLAPDTQNGDTTNLDKVIANLTDTSNMKVGMDVSGAGIQSDSIITEIISATSIRISKTASATATASLTFKDTITVNGLVSTTNAPNGRYLVDSLGVGANEVNFTAASTPTGSPTVLNAFARPDIHVCKLSCTGAAPSEYNISNVDAYILSDTESYYRVGSSALPSLPTAGGPIELDGVIAMSTVDGTFVNNPYPGPIQWDQDIVVKGVIGDKYFKIPQTAIGYTVGEDPDQSPNVNQFNVNGQTGTLNLENGDVAYVNLKRNIIASAGAQFQCLVSTTITGVAAPLDEDSNPLESGDFVKFEDEPESYWKRIDLVIGNSVSLINDDNTSPSLAQRPVKTGRLVYCKGTYSKIYVKKHWLVSDNADVWWLAVRRDNGNAANPKVYFKGLELEAGEVRQINDNQVSNLLLYTGANSEAAVNPNYSVSDLLGPYRPTETVTVSAIDAPTRMVTFGSAPDNGFQIGDSFLKVVGINSYSWTVKNVLSTRTVVLQEELGNLALSDDLTYFRINQNIEDQDNLTRALRKEDRELGSVQTALKKPVYDENVYVQKIALLGAGTVKSGSYIYKGTPSSPTALAWVIHGNAAVAETIEGASISMPGGHVTVGANAVLVHIYFGSFNHGDAVLQNGASTGRTVNNPSNPPFTAPTLYGDTGGTGLELVLPPNRRTQVVGSEYVVYGTHSKYKASDVPELAGEELMVIANDTIRQAITDYTETFGGPKAKIKLVRTYPENTRMRFRVLTTFGSAIAAKALDTTLQTAYNGGANIQCAPNVPVSISATDINGGEAAEIIRGSLKIEGGTSALGGIFNETNDQSFVIGRENNKPKETWTGLDAVKTHNSHPDSAWKRKSAAQTVTGATGTAITDSALTLTDNEAYRVRISAVARRSDGTFGVSSFSMEGTFYRSGGTAQAAGSPISTINGFDGDGAAYAVAFGLSGNDVVAVVYGSSGATVQWALSIEWQAVGLAS